MSIRADSNGDDDGIAMNGMTGQPGHTMEGLNTPGLSEKHPPMNKSCSDKAHVHEVTAKIVGAYSEIPSHAARAPSNVRSHDVKVDTKPSQVEESPASLGHIIEAKPTATLYTVEQHSTPFPLTPFIQPMSPSSSSEPSQHCLRRTGTIMLSFTDDIKEKVLVPSLSMYADYYMLSHGYTYHARVEVVVMFANSCNREDVVTHLHGADIPAKHLKFVYFLCKNCI
ncbi:uncharacterized protein LAESUDRAFT_714144 [Laetiporus sulphureus 93-53]|uniref:Uncharacterized protein n=1 Tax=Laetiporus sulphureus 93-53 TaxID=1314785 RepID=A0A165EC22_9APHY|nr:uncharacterized protein LAESUDRAFT_714144 [Laetiporus sulphureus 93-53]KZT06700.1 hypothetical protein LAESUDRAFT_714144 [Laetiporus sulphureus 93-53]